MSWACWWAFVCKILVQLLQFNVLENACRVLERIWLFSDQLSWAYFALVSCYCVGVCCGNYDLISGEFEINRARIVWEFVFTNELKSHGIVWEDGVDSFSEDGEKSVILRELRDSDIGAKGKRVPFLKLELCVNLHQGHKHENDSQIDSCLHHKTRRLINKLCKSWKVKTLQTFI